MSRNKTKNEIKQAEVSQQDILIKEALEQYSDKRFGENDERGIKYKKSLEKEEFLNKNIEALKHVSLFLHSACYSNDKDYEIDRMDFIEKILKVDNREIGEMKIFLIKNHENLSDVSLLNDLKISKYFKRLDDVLKKCKIFNIK